MTVGHGYMLGAYPLVQLHAHRRHHAELASDVGASAFFFHYLGACRRRTPRTRADLKVPRDTPHPRRSRCHPPFSIEPLGARRRRSPSAFAKNRRGAPSEPTWSWFRDMPLPNHPGALSISSRSSDPSSSNPSCSALPASSPVGNSDRSGANLCGYALYIVMVYVVMAHIVMAYVVMAYI